MAKNITRKGVKYSIDNNVATVLGLSKKDVEHLEVPDEIDGCSVQYIMPKAFKDNHFLVTVSLPEAIAHITNAVFYRCGRLQEVEFRGSQNDLILHYYSIAFCNVLKNIKCNRHVRCESAAIIGCDALDKSFLNN